MELDLVVPQLKTLVRIDGAEHVSFEGVGFRDSVATYMAAEWSAPSGGDWALYHGGALEITNADDVNITGCTFRRVSAC